LDKALETFQPRRELARE